MLFRFISVLIKHAEHKPPFFQSSCSIFTIMSALSTETSVALTSPTLFSSISPHLSPFPSFFCLQLVAHHFNHSFASTLKNLALLWERERVGRFGRMALKHVKYHVWNELPVQVRCTILDAWGLCTGMTQSNGTGREEGSGWGTRVYLWRIHVDIWQNQYNIVKLKNKIKTCCRIS